MLLQQMRRAPFTMAFLVLVIAHLALAQSSSSSSSSSSSLLGLDDDATVPYLSAWKWILYLGIIVAFIDGFGIGANDVANSFATSVGSGSLTLKQAVLIGCFTEAGGAILLGKNTSETIRGKIVAVSLFDSNPSALALGMLCAAIGSATFVLFATRQGWPISTTHAIVGALVGIGIVAFGSDGVEWGFSGLGGIIASWFISPVMAGCIAATVWKITETFVLKSSDSFERALRYIPIYFAITFTFISFFMLYKGMPGIDVASWFGSDYAPPIISLVLGAAAALGAWKIYVPWVRKNTQTAFDASSASSSSSSSALLPASADDSASFAELEEQKDAPNGHSAHDDSSAHAASNGHSSSSSLLSASSATVKKEAFASNADGEEHFVAGSTQAAQAASWDKLSVFEKASFMATRGLNIDVVHHPELDSMHALVPKYDTKTEMLYSSLQVLTAAFASFAHGSNDIANAVGPLSTIYAVYQVNFQSVNNTSNPVPIWIILLCTTGLDLGLLLYGYNIMRELGNKITYHSPARGFCMELSAGFAVLVASKLGWPVSTTHCITGATLAVGLASGDVNAVNWKRSMLYFFAWVICVPVSAAISGVLFTIMAYSPKAYVPSLTGGNSI